VITPDAEHACWLVPFSVKPGTNTIDIDIMLAEGEWKTVVTAEHSQVGRPAGGYETEVGGIAFTHVSENPRNPQGSVVYVAHEVNDQQFDVLAIDSQGNEVNCDDVFSDKLGGFRTVRYEFGIAPDQIKAFVAKVRPYTKRVVAKDITLDPTKPTKPEITVSEIKPGGKTSGK